MGVKVYIFNSIKNRIKNNKKIGPIYPAIRSKLLSIIAFFVPDKYLIKRRYKSIFGYELNVSNPLTLNEKIQWLKLYDRKKFHTQCADKYTVRQFLEGNFGKEYLIPLLFATKNWKNINEKNITSFPCIIKPNHTSGDYMILRKKEDVDWNGLRRTCKNWLKINYYTISQEWQYKNIKRQIIVEKLLQTSEGKLPNDYKLHYINGNLEFIYVSVDRESGNKRNIYNPEWKPLYFSWVAKSKDPNTIRGPEINPPLSINKMKEFGNKIAQNFKYVRVDFYDVDGQLFFGEITLYHGGGFDVFVPAEYDLYYGKRLQL